MKKPESSGVKMDTLQVSFVKSGLTTHADVDESCVCTTREQNVTINTVNNVNILTLENPGENQLIETEDKKDLKQKMRESAVLLSELERENLKQPEDYNKGKFATYILDREKTVLRKSMRETRRYALKMSNLTVPPKLYTNQSETEKSCPKIQKERRHFKVHIYQENFPDVSGSSTSLNRKSTYWPKF